MSTTLSEAGFSSQITDLAALRGWTWCHYRPARTANGWVTPLSGHPGAPDLILARDGVVLLAEVKTARGRLSGAQEDWLAALGAHGRVWRPGDWDDLAAELSAPRERGRT